jgi:hypothetical protein
MRIWSGRGKGLSGATINIVLVSNPPVQTFFKIFFGPPFYHWRTGTSSIAVLLSGKKLIILLPARYLPVRNCDQKIGIDDILHAGGTYIPQSLLFQNLPSETNFKGWCPKGKKRHQPNCKPKTSHLIPI